MCEAPKHVVAITTQPTFPLQFSDNSHSGRDGTEHGEAGYGTQNRHHDGDASVGQ